MSVGGNEAKSGTPKAVVFRTKITWRLEKLIKPFVEFAIFLVTNAIRAITLRWLSVRRQSIPRLRRR